MSFDPIAFAAALIRCPSVTPAEAGTLDMLQTELEKLNFTCHRLPFATLPETDASEAAATETGTEAATTATTGTETTTETEDAIDTAMIQAARVDNLYARWGDKTPHFCFAGHVDVVPPGATEDWSYPPFGGTLAEGRLWGRGAVDMKTAIAAFIAAVVRFQAENPNPSGSISLLITGDEEGPAINGTAKMLEWLAERQEKIDDCLVGEPTNDKRLGDKVKIGRRGSVNGVITLYGTQGHVAYPAQADNPIDYLLPLMHGLHEAKLDDGNARFQPSKLEITSFDVGNPTTNIIPAIAQARFNIRYNDIWTKQSIAEWIEDTLNQTYEQVVSDRQAAGQQTEARMEFTLHHSAEPFLSGSERLNKLVSHAVEKITGLQPALSTDGGTSDARFISQYTRVIEFGLVGQTMHKIDEHTEIADIEKLTDIYYEILKSYFIG